MSGQIVVCRCNRRYNPQERQTKYSPFTNHNLRNSATADGCGSTPSCPRPGAALIGPIVVPDSMRVAVAGIGYVPGFLLSLVDNEGVLEEVDGPLTNSDERTALASARSKTEGKSDECAGLSANRGLYDGNRGSRAVAGQWPKREVRVPTPSPGDRPGLCRERLRPRGY